MALMLIRDWFSNNPPPIDTAEDGSNVVSIPDSRNIGRIRSLLVVESLSDHSLFRRVIQPCFFSIDQTKLKLDSLHCFVHSLMHLFGLFFFSFIGVLVCRPYMHALSTIAYVCFFALCWHGHVLGIVCLCLKSLVHWINLATCSHLSFKTSSLSPCALFLSSDCMCAWMHMCFFCMSNCKLSLLC